ncbi:uncharacterized protein LOC132548805 [Ylistrum balloti]|uniref:uncharacterized protein LOC132548805 n=1 Tax=Ylistrum balloti TaxID=509963 RepID=UPI002905D818|nr:uncharacterized protein LOC132548805 [Ylistrum balloti]
MEDVTKTKCYIRLKLAMKVSFMMNVVLVVALTCLYIARKATYSDLADITPNTLSQSHAEKLLDRICLSCSYLDNAGKDTLYDNVLATSGGQLCCVNDEHGFQDVLLKMLNEHPGDLIKHAASDVEETIRKLQWWRERDFSAHLYADYHDVQSKYF